MILEHFANSLCVRPGREIGLQKEGVNGIVFLNNYYIYINSNTFIYIYIIYIQNVVTHLSTSPCKMLPMVTSVNISLHTGGLT